MTIINYQALIYLALAVPIAVLYLWRVRPRRRSVGLGFLWEEVLRKDGAEGHRSAWWTLRRPVSLGIQLSILTLIAVAAAEPVFPPPEQLVLVVDDSASMQATDAKPTRFDQAKQLAGRYVDTLGYRGQIAVISGGDPLRVHCPLTGRQDTLRESLAKLEPTGGKTRVSDAVDLGRRMSTGRPNAGIIVLSDGCFDEAIELARQEDVQFLPIGTAGDNVAITALEARRCTTDPSKCQVLVEVTAFSDKPVERKLTIEFGDRPIDEQPIGLTASGHWKQVFEMTTAQGGLLTARLDQSDALASDDTASVVVPDSRVRPVVLVTDGNLYLEQSLKANRLVKLTVSDTIPTEIAEGTILVLDRRIPPAAADGRILEAPMLVFDPGAACELWTMGDAVQQETIADQDDDLALLADVRLEGVRVSSPHRIVPTEKPQSTARPLAWTAGGVPVGYAIDRPGGRVLVISGMLEGSDLPLRTAFPILTANALAWLSESDVQSAVGNGARERLIDARPPVEESDIRVPRQLASRAERPLPARAALPVWPLPAALALLLVVAEWCLFQRRWVV